MPGPLFVGLMSGTSLDGIDAVLVRFPADPSAQGVELLASGFTPFASSLRESILSLCAPGQNEIDRAGELDVLLGQQFAQAALRVIREAGITPGQVTAIGSHGQTLRHRPAAQHPFTLQVADPNTISAITGITTVADFRRRDMAAGGQGAPLVPAFHAAMFGSTAENRAVVNIGGMANVTVLPAGADGVVMGFDTGPGNVLLDAWHLQCRGTPIDRDGAWGAQGTVDERLLERLLAHPFFKAHPPKSTGREQFDLAWLREVLAGGPATSAPDVQATLAEFTARCIADALRRWAGPLDRVYLCGGGTHNQDLCRRLAGFSPAPLQSTTSLGVEPDWVEAIAFAWLARRTLAGLGGNLPAVTGAREVAVLGGIYPGLGYRLTPAS